MPPGIVIAFKKINIWAFVGLNQVISENNLEEKNDFVVSGVYRYVRHPLYFFSLLFLWLFPVMTFNILAFNIGSTIYMLVGSFFEEKKLLVEFGSSYEKYQKETPRIIPRLKNS